RNDLSDQQRVQARLALGADYRKAGLLDRAATAFTELAQLDPRAPPAPKHRTSIHPPQPAWAHATATAPRDGRATGEPRGRPTAPGDIDAAREAGRRAYAAASKSVRAGILEGRVEIDAGNDAAAIRALERAARHDTDFLPEIIPLLRSAYERIGDAPGARNFLAEMTEHYRGIAPVLALTRLLEAEKGTSAARAYLTEQLKEDRK